MDAIENEAILICARLMRQGYVKKDEFRNLELNERLLQQVQYRLAQVGAKLVLNTYSPYYAVRLLPEIQENLDESNSLGLKVNEVAMLVILWCKLILPKRLSLEAQTKLTTEIENKNKLTNIQTENAATNSTDSSITNITANPVNSSNPSNPEKNGSAETLKETASGTNSTTVVPELPNTESIATGIPNVAPTAPVATGTPNAMPSTPTTQGNTKEEAAETTKYYIKMNELWAEFGENFGNKTIFKATLTRLNNLQFIRIRDEIISEGILLDLLIDSHQMANEVKRSALAHKLAGLQDESSESTDELEEEDSLEDVINDAENPKKIE